MRSFEAESLHNADIDRFYQKATERLAAGGFKEEEFIDPYGEQTVGADLIEVKKREAVHNRTRDEQTEEQKKVADIFEAIVLEVGELNEWWGSNAFILQTSKYDDYVNGVDAVIEFRVEDPKSASYLGLATDVTFSGDTGDKFLRIFSQIDSGNLTKVKYFHSKHMGIHGPLSDLPKVIIGAHRETVLEVAEKWIAGKYNALARHKLQIMILLQTVEQLRVFRNYAKKIGKEDLVRIYSERITVVERILEEKKDIYNQVKSDLNDDNVHYSIMDFLKRKQREIDQM
jgi:hypothetical protein